MDVFRVLGNSNRMHMLKILMKQSRHISGLAKELNISAPVALRHARILEQAGFIERQKTGSIHMLRVRDEAVNKIRKILGLFEKPFIVEVPKGTKMLEALKKISGIKTEGTKEGTFISEVDGKKGYYIYEVNGRMPNRPINRFEIKKDIELEFKQLLPVIGKKIKIKVL